MSNEIKLGTIQLKGWQALAAFVLVIAFMGFRSFGDRSVTDTHLLDALRTEIEMERTRNQLPDMTEAIQNYNENSDEQEYADLVDRTLAKIEFEEVTASKKIVSVLTDDEVVVFVRYRWPHDTDSIIERYYRVERQGFTGWWIRSETDVVSYYLNRL